MVFALLKLPQKPAGFALMPPANILVRHLRRASPAAFRRKQERRQKS